MKVFFLFMLIVILPSYLFGQDDSLKLYDQRSFQFYLEEDLNPIQLFPKATDQNYTMGFGFGFSNPKYESSFITYPLRKVDTWILGKEITNGPNTLLLSPLITLNGTAFTPDDLRAVEPVRNDRPYAFLLTVSTKKGYVLKDKDLIVNSELNIGALGLPVGKWVQTFIHKLMNDNDTKPPYTPRGWHNQIANGFAPAFLYSLSVEKLLLKQISASEKDRSFFDFKVGAGSSIGYYTQVNGSATLRLGLLDKINWIRNFNPLGNMNKIAHKDRKLWEIYIFAGARPTLMLYNAMLHGSIWRSSEHTLRWNQTRPLIMEWNSGIQIHIPFKNAKALDLTWVVNAGRTSELKTDLSRSHNWGSIYCGYTW